MTAKKKKKARKAPARKKSAAAKPERVAKQAAKPKRSAGDDEAHYSDMRRLGGSFASRRLV